MKIESTSAQVGASPHERAEFLDALEAIPMATLTSATGLQPPRGG